MAHDILRQYLEHKYPDTKVERMLTSYFRDVNGNLIKMTPLFFRNSCIGYQTFYNNVIYFFETPELIELESRISK